MQGGQGLLSERWPNSPVLTGRRLRLGPAAEISGHWDRKGCNLVWVGNHGYTAAGPNLSLLPASTGELGHLSLSKPWPPCVCMESRITQACPPTEACSSCPGPDMPLQIAGYDLVLGIAADR